MDINGSIAELSKKLDEWLQDYLAAAESQDRLVMGKTLLHGIEIRQELDRIKAKGLAAVAAVLDRRDTITDEGHVVALVQSFVLAVGLRDALTNELMDIDGGNEGVDQMNAIAEALDAIGGNRRLALTPLLDHQNVGVRASAGAYLLASMPDRVLPILREIEQNEHANSAHYTAYWARLRWEMDGK
jgi:hypothetical protein